ncbi:MAG: hypothetical protein M3O34_20555 [Chloroflexota bacterium]|nr:hypothetical protein [Chloroflexota bacterium]
MQGGPSPRPFDVSPKYLIEGDPEAWLAWVGLPVNGPVQTIDTDVSTVLAEVDKVLRVGAPSPWLAHFELQASRDRRLPFRLLQYHTLLLHRHGLPVESTVVLLRPEAEGPELSGRLEQHGATGDVTVSFGFRVVRLWERPVEELLGGGLGVLPLAPLAAVEAARLPDVIQPLDERFRREADPASAADLWAATQLLLGLRYDDARVRELLRGVTRMRESSTYRAILDEGRAEGLSQGLAQGRAEGRVIEARRMLLALGAEKLGPPTPAVVMALEDLDDLETLERLINRVLTAPTWQELLASASGR